jgi:hypothetical protein
VLLGALIVLAGIVLGPMRAALPARPAAISAPDIAMPLNAAGAGSQTVANMELNYALSPYPALAGADAVLTLTPRDLRTASRRALSATLEVAPIDRVDGTQFALTPQGRALVARGAFFPAPGDYRMRVTIAGIFPDEGYVTLVVVRVP